MNDLMKTTIQIQERLRKIYLETYERSHYIFAIDDLDKVFRRLLTRFKGSPKIDEEQLLMLWRHECDWIYGKRMVSLN